MCNCQVLSCRQRWGIQLQRHHIAELESSTPAKWSRHLIVRLPGFAFKHNGHVGRFVEALLDAPEVCACALRGSEAIHSFGGFSVQAARWRCGGAGGRAGGAGLTDAGNVVNFKRWIKVSGFVDRQCTEDSLERKAGRGRVEARCIVTPRWRAARCKKICRACWGGLAKPLLAAQPRTTNPELPLSAAGGRADAAEECARRSGDAVHLHG